MQSNIKQSGIFWSSENQQTDSMKYINWIMNMFPRFYSFTHVIGAMNIHANEFS